MHRVVDLGHDALQLIVFDVIFELDLFREEDSAGHELDVDLHYLIVLQAREIVRSAGFEIELRVAVGCDREVAVHTVQGEGLVGGVQILDRAP